MNGCLLSGDVAGFGVARCMGGREGGYRVNYIISELAQQLNCEGLVTARILFFIGLLEDA